MSATSGLRHHWLPASAAPDGGRELVADGQYVVMLLQAKGWHDTEKADAFAPDLPVMHPRLTDYRLVVWRYHGNVHHAGPRLKVDVREAIKAGDLAVQKSDKIPFFDSCAAVARRTTEDFGRSEPIDGELVDRE